MDTPALLARYVMFMICKKTVLTLRCFTFWMTFVLFVFQCGQPMQTSRCVDCGAVIGGNNHNPVQGFQILGPQYVFPKIHCKIYTAEGKSRYFACFYLFFDRGDRTQTGHVLGDPRRRDNPDMLDTKSISQVPFTVVRMLTHLAMLLGACNHPQVAGQNWTFKVLNLSTFLLSSSSPVVMEKNIISDILFLYLFVFLVNLCNHQASSSWPSCVSFCALAKRSWTSYQVSW